MTTTHHNTKVFFKILLLTLATGLLVGIGSCSKETADEISVTQISVTAGTSTLAVGQELQLTAAVAPEGSPNKSVVWSSGNNSIATVDETGKVTGIDVGTVTITATSQQNPNVRSVVLLEIVPFTVAVTGLSITIPSEGPEVGSTLQLIPIITPENAADKTLIWSSSDGTIATVDETGKVTGIARGQVTITATSQSNPEISSIVVLQILGTNEILSFTIQGMESVQPTISDTEIMFVVDFNRVGRGLDVSTLVPDIEHNGATVDPASGTPQDFTGGPATYTVTSEDGRVRIYAVSVKSQPGTEFITSWNDVINITIPVDPTFVYDYNVDLDQDGFIDQSGISGDLILDFDLREDRTIGISGLFPALRMEDSSTENRDAFVSLDQWGTGEWLSMEKAFSECVNLETPATDVPDFSGVRTMEEMFQNAASANPETSQWNTSNVINMISMFENAVSANPDVRNWNTSNVSDMEEMFKNAVSANPDVRNWNTSNVTNMEEMFQNAEKANPDVRDWNMSKVTDIVGMFEGAINAEPDVRNWDTSALRVAFRAFNLAVKANPDLSNWNISQFNNPISASNIFADSGITCDNYGKALLRFVEHIDDPNNEGLTLPLNIDLRSIPVKTFSAAATSARITLEANGWQFDENPNANCSL